MTTKPCSNCGKEVHVGSPLKSHERICRLFPGVIKLKEMWEVERKSKKEIARECGVSDWTVGKWLIEHALYEKEEVIRSYTYGRRKNNLEKLKPTRICNPRNKCKECTYIVDCRIAILEIGFSYCETPDEDQYLHLKRKGVDVSMLGKSDV